jgi:predicted sugar kinase
MDLEVAEFWGLSISRASARQDMARADLASLAGTVARSAFTALATSPVSGFSGGFGSTGGATVALLVLRPLVFRPVLVVVAEVPG